MQPHFTIKNASWAWLGKLKSCKYCASVVSTRYMANPGDWRLDHQPTTQPAVFFSFFLYQPTEMNGVPPPPRAEGEKLKVYDR